MNYKIIITEEFDKKIKKFLKKHHDMYPKVVITMTLLADNPFHPSLRLHKLQGNLADYHSVSMDMSYRIVIEFIIKDGQTIPIGIGSHDEVY